MSVTPRREPVELNRVAKVELQGRDPGKTFYLAVSIGNLDGSMDELHSEGFEACEETEEAAIAAAMDTNDSYPTLEAYVFKCVPVARIWRGKIRVTKLPGGRA